MLKKIKLKISPANYVDVLAELDEIKKRHEDVELMVDANGTFDPTYAAHLQILEELDDQGLLMIEEPVSRVGVVKGIEAVRILRKAIPVFNTPICLDDSLTDNETATRALNENLCDIINIKPGRIGSIVKSIELANFCKRMEKQIMVGGMLEATPGRIMTTTLAAYFNTLGSRIPGDLSLAQDRLLEDLVPPSSQLNIGPNGGIILPSSPGWGFEMDNLRI